MKKYALLFLLFFTAHVNAQSYRGGEIFQIKNTNIYIGLL